MEGAANSDDNKTPKPLSNEELSIVGKSSRPNFAPLPRSSLLARLRSFIPQLEQANATIENNIVDGGGIDIERVVESSSDSDSDSDSELSEDEVCGEDEEMEEEKEKEKKEASVVPAIQMKLSLFKEGSRMEEEAEKSLPEAFRDEREDVKPISPKKKLIEEL